MTEIPLASLLPAGARMRMDREDAKADAAAKEAEREQETHREELRQRHLTLYREAAEQRGEVVDVLAMARGETPGRALEDILAAARDAADRDDALSQARLTHQGREPVHVDVGEPVLLTPAARSARLRIASRSRHWQEWQQKKAAAEAARRAVEADRDLGLVENVHPRRRRP